MVVVVVVAPATTTALSSFHVMCASVQGDHLSGKPENVR